MIQSLIENGIDDLQNFLVVIGSWDGGIRQFLVDRLCDPEIIERFMANEANRCF